LIELGRPVERGGAIGDEGKHRIELADAKHFEDCGIDVAEDDLTAALSDQTHQHDEQAQHRRAGEPDAEQIDDQHGTPVQTEMIFVLATKFLDRGRIEPIAIPEFRHQGVFFGVDLNSGFEHGTTYPRRFVVAPWLGRTDRCDKRKSLTLVSRHNAHEADSGIYRESSANSIESVPS